LRRAERPTRAGRPPQSGFALYLRQAGVASGPYPRGLLERYVELGRIRPGDELSRDGVHWHAVDHLLPGVTALESAPADTASWDLERQRARLRWIEERDGGDRRKPGTGPIPDAVRSGKDRRSAPSAPIPSRPPEFSAHTHWRRWNSAFVVLGVVAGVVLMALLLSTLAPGLVIRIPSRPG